MEEFEVFTIAGTGVIGNEDGSGNEANFKFPQGIAIRADETIIVADKDNNKIRGIDPDGNVYTIAGTGEYGDKDGSVNEATLSYPQGITIRDDGTIIVAGSYTDKIRAIDLDGNVFTIVGTQEEEGDKSMVFRPQGMAVRDDGTIIISDVNNNKIRGIDLDGNVFTIAGTGEEGDKDGPGNEATFNYPEGIAIKGDGTIIVADTYNHKIRGIDLDGNVFTIAGTGERRVIGDKDGPGNEATFRYPQGVAIRDDGTIIVADTSNNKIRGIDPNGNVYTIAGTEEQEDKDGPGNEATFNWPQGIAIKNDGIIIVIDTDNNKIRGIGQKKLVKSAIE